MENKINESEYFFKKHNKICNKFDTLRNLFPDELSSGKYYFKAGPSKRYCPNGGCNNDIDKINGYCLWLFNQLYKDKIDFSNNANDNMNIVTYILGWLSYKLNQKTENKITTLNDFYTTYIKNGEGYNNIIENVTKYKTYKEIIDGNNKLMDIDIKIMSKFYHAFNNMCKMYNELLEAKKNGEKYLKYVNNFVENYNTLFNDTNSNLFKQVLSGVSNDYNYIKSKLDVESIRNQFPELSNERTETQVSSSSKEPQIDDSSSGTSTLNSKIEVSDSEPETLNFETDVSNSETTLLSSLIINKLIPIPFMFFVILIILGIAYKVNNKSIKNIFITEYFVNINKLYIFNNFYISIHYLDFGNDLKNDI
ncbi:putative bir1 protein [Plasmodium yoelii yoelii]|uniref:Bir1 protein n=1 Tax=Plasmodium yoelii yoelii TaxID=73239 RepID=Q7RBJ4_PLAYO|nr:putative bir1 protein [Plasmodium yoelii yoelii]